MSLYPFGEVCQARWIHFEDKSHPNRLKPIQFYKQKCLLACLSNRWAIKFREIRFRGKDLYL